MAEHHLCLFDLVLFSAPVSGGNSDDKSLSSMSEPWPTYLLHFCFNSRSFAFRCQSTISGTLAYLLLGNPFTEILQSFWPFLSRSCTDSCAILCFVHPHFASGCRGSTLTKFIRQWSGEQLFWPTSFKTLWFILILGTVSSIFIRGQLYVQILATMNCA